MALVRAQVAVGLESKDRVELVQHHDNPRDILGASLMDHVDVEGSDGYSTRYRRKATDQYEFDAGVSQKLD